MIRHRTAASAVVTGLLAAVLCLGPVRFGGVLPPERVLLDVAALVALTVALLDQRRLSVLAPARLPAMAFAGIALIGLVQLAPLPTPMVAMVSPHAADLWRGAQELLAVDQEPPPASASAVTGGAGGGYQGPGLAQVTVAPGATGRTVVHWLAVVAAFLAAAAQGRERSARRLLVIAFGASAAFQVLYGARAWAVRKAEILGVGVPGDPSRLRGTFVNPDHLAFYLGLALACAMAWLWWTGRRLTSGKVEADVGGTRLALALLFFFLVATGLGFSGSRSGLLAALAAVSIQGVLLIGRGGWGERQSWRQGGWLVLATFAGIASLAVFGWRRVLGRWLETSVYDLAWDSRVATWRASLDLWLDFPLLGTGLGTFGAAFPRVQPANLPQAWDHAHSDVLELLVTAGPFGLVLAAVAAQQLLVGAWRLTRGGRRSEDRAFGLAVCGVIVYAICHSLVDFGLTLPVNAFTLAVLCGLATTAATGRRPPKPRSGLTVHLRETESAADVPDDAPADDSGGRGTA